MKHTYLYPVVNNDLWLWRAGRMDADDLFGVPNLNAPDDFWAMNVGIADALGAARKRLFGRLKNRDRICVGRHYAIPGSLSDTAQERQREADLVVHQITSLTWDAPILDSYLSNEMRLLLRQSAGTEGRDEWSEISTFLAAQEGHRVIPVWM